MPDLAGTLGLSLVAAMQAAIFTKVEGVPCSTVMITGNMRQAVENSLCGGRWWSASRDFAPHRAFSLRYARRTASAPLSAPSPPSNSLNLALGVPVVALLIVLLRCEFARPGADR